MTRKGCPQPQWTRKQEMLVCHMREAGKSIGECAAAVGKSYGAVSVRLSKLGATKVNDRGRRGRGEFLAAVAALCVPAASRHRRSDKDIAAILDVYPQEVFRARKKLGIRRQITPHQCAARAARRRTGDYRWGQGGKHERPQQPLTPDQRSLAEGLALSGGVVAAIARSLAGMFPRDLDAVESAVALAVVKAARTFDPAKQRAGDPKAFFNHAYCTARGEVMMLVRESRPLGYRKDKDVPPAVITRGDIA